MKHLNKVIATLLIGGSLAGTSWLVMAGNNSGDDARAVAEAQLNIYNALEVAQQHAPGTIVSAELEHEDEALVWEVEVVAANGDEIELEIDAITGELTDREVESADSDDDERDAS